MRQTPYNMSLFKDLYSDLNDEQRKLVIFMVEFCPKNSLQESVEHAVEIVKIPSLLNWNYDDIESEWNNITNLPDIW